MGVLICIGGGGYRCNVCARDIKEAYMKSYYNSKDDFVFDVNEITHLCYSKIFELIKKGNLEACIYFLEKIAPRKISKEAEEALGRILDRMENEHVVPAIIQPKTSPDNVTEKEL